MKTYGLVALAGLCFGVFGALAEDFPARGRLSSGGGSSAAGWTESGGITSTPDYVEIGARPANADAGYLGVGSLRAWNFVEGRGTLWAAPGAGNPVNGFVRLGSTDVAEGAICISQDGAGGAVHFAGCSQTNFFAVGNGSANEVNADSLLSFAIQDRRGLALGPVTTPNDIPEVRVAKSLEVGAGDETSFDTDPSVCRDGGVCLASDIIFRGTQPSSSSRGATGSGIIWPAVSGNHWEIWGLSNSSLEIGNNGVSYLGMTTSGIVTTQFGIASATGTLSIGSASNKGSTALTTGSATATVLSGAICTCSLSVGTVWPKCAVAATTLTITGTGSDTVTYTCL